VPRRYDLIPKHMRIAQAVVFALEWTGLRARLQALWRRDISRSATSANRRTDKTLGTLRRLSDEQRQLQHATDVRVREIERRVAASHAAVLDLEQRLTDLERTHLADSRQARQVSDWQLRVDPAAICAHVSRAVSDAPLSEAPTAHLVVEELFPPDFYELVLASLPAIDHLQASDSNERHVRPAEFRIVPRLTTLMWEFIDTEVARAIASAALPRLHPFLEARYVALFGRERAGAALNLPHEPSPGRLLLRRRGDCEKPHLDPKKTSVSVLMNLAKPGEPETGGTRLYAIDGDFTPVHTNTAYPGAHGLTCRLVSQVPFRPNTALILMNARAAHGADAPDILPAELVRYAFEFGLGPGTLQLLDFVATLPPSAQQQWLGLALPTA